MTDHSQLVKTLRVRGGKMNLASADAIDALNAECQASMAEIAAGRERAERAEAERDTLQDQVLALKNTSGLSDVFSSAERDALQARVEALEAGHHRLLSAANAMLAGVSYHNGLDAGAGARREDIKGPVVDALHNAAHNSRLLLERNPT